MGDEVVAYLGLVIPEAVNCAGLLGVKPVLTGKVSIRKSILLFQEQLLADPCTVHPTFQLNELEKSLGNLTTIFPPAGMDRFNCKMNV